VLWDGGGRLIWNWTLTKEVLGMSWMYRAYTTNRSTSPTFLGGVPAEAVHRDRSDLQDYAVLPIAPSCHPMRL
jgi:hypothetical protein